MRRFANALIGGLSICLLGAGMGACGGQNGTLSVTILVPPGQDPFAMANTVSMSLGGTTTTAPVTGGTFNASLQISNPSGTDSGQLVVEALSASGAVLGRGITPSFVIQAQDGSATVYVGVPGQVTPTTLALPEGRTDLSGAVLRGTVGGTDFGLGVVISGGLNSSGASVDTAWFFDPSAQALVAAGTPLVARRGAVMVPSSDTNVGQQSILWGGAVAANNVNTSLPTTAEVFDLAAATVNTLFAPPSADVDAGGPGAIDPAVSELAANVFVASGGTDASGNALNQAVILARYPDSATATTFHGGVRRVPTPKGMSGPMLVARAGHTSTAVTLAEGPGALIFGGALNGQPAAELYNSSTQTFKPLPVPSGGTAPTTRKYHVAVALTGGQVLCAGGVDTLGFVLGDAMIIDPNVGTVQSITSFLTTPRSKATASVVGQEIVICGGLDDNNKPIANCEVFSASTAQKTRAVTLPNPRAGHIALYQPDTEQLLLVGGLGQNLMPTPSIDIFTSM